MNRSLLHRILTYFRPPEPSGTTQQADDRPSTVPSGRRIYAIGDVHGLSDLLGRMADRIEADLGHNPVPEARAVFLGDYVDRGPDSRGVIDRLARGDFPVPFETLRGNHEDLMLRALARPDAMPDWCACGGIETLRSYGVDIGKAAPRKRSEKLHRDLLEVLPPSHRDFLERTRLSEVVGDYFFVHAGARPGVPLDRQDEADLMWIRDECYKAPKPFDKVLVHGHTPHRKPENLPGRINIDTGAFKWGVLSCVVLEGQERRFLSTEH